MTTETFEVPVRLPEAEDCTQCVERFRDTLGSVRGIATVDLDVQARRLILTYDPAILPIAVLEAQIQEAGAAVARRFRHVTLRLEGLHCPDCAHAVEHAVTHVPGVLSAVASFVAASLRVEYDADVMDLDRIAAAVSQTGYRAVVPGARSDMAVVRVPEMDCQDEVKVIEGKLRTLPGIVSWQVNVLERTLRIQFDSETLAPNALLAAIRGLGMSPVLASQAAAHVAWQRDPLLLSTAASGVLLGSAMLAAWLEAPSALVISLATLAMLAGCWMTARKAVRAVLARRLDMNVLMTIAVAGAVGIGEWGEGAMVVFLFALAQLLETYSLDRARQAVRRLLDITPPEATVRRDGQEVRLPVAMVAPGELILIRPGERVPLDGVVQGGNSGVNQAPITGESMPVEKAPGAQVFAGSINGEGALELEVTHRAEDTTLARIIALVEEAQTQKAPAQAFVERFAAIYTPAVMVGALLIAVAPPLLLGQPAWPWIYRALVLLVIACPCALVISTPVTVVCGLARAARAGVLIKGGKYLEALGQLKALALDKTGTLTQGRPEVVTILPLNWSDRNYILRMAAAVEARSEHPLATAILRAARAEGITWPESSGFTTVPGRGAYAELNGQRYHLGSHRYAEELGICKGEIDRHLRELEEAGQTPAILSDGAQVLGILGLADQVRTTSAGALRRLHDLSVAPLVMLTGDVRRTAEAIAQRVGVDEVRAELLPDQKVAAIKELVQVHESAGMVGDGINDAPALAAATVGIAMGAAGTDAAIETADVALMSDDLQQLPFAVALGRRALWIIRTNIGLSLVTKAAFVLLAALGEATLWMAVAADMGTSLVVIFNGMRLLRNGHYASEGGKGEEHRDRTAKEG
jgi:Zn2+/Cd2+-exporting ATPase